MSATIRGAGERNPRRLAVCGKVSCAQIDVRYSQGVIGRVGMPRPNDGAWFHVVLVRVPLASVALLKEQARKPKEDRVSVKTRTISAPRFTGRDVNGAFGVRRVSVQPLADAVDLSWEQSMPHGRRHARKNAAILGRCAILEFGDYLVLAQAFTSEDDARVWAAERHEMPLPRAA